MRVLFNVESLLNPPLTGVGHYARHVLDGLLAPDSGVQAVCFARGRVVAPPGAVVAAGGAGRSMGLRRALRAVPGMDAARDWVRGRQLGRAVSGLGVDLYHEPNHILQPVPGPAVLTIHDLSAIHLPGFHPADRVRQFRRSLAESARRAALILVDSAHAAADVSASLGVEAARVRVVPLGVDPAFRPTRDDGVLARYGLRRGGYILTVGTREPRKNHARLLDAWLSLPGVVRAEHVLVFVGPAGWRAQAMERRLDALEDGGQVRRLGYVPDADRAALYSGAAVFAYPSLYEGFGLPPLEAAACGAAVLTSRGSPMEETLGGVALLVDPVDTAAIAAGLSALLADPGVGAAGPGRAAAFTWERCVTGTIAAYRAVG